MRLPSFALSSCNSLVRNGIAAFVLSCMLLLAQSSLADLKSEHDPARRSDRALALAEENFDDARAFYDRGAIQKGDARLEDMTNALNECVESLSSAHKARLYKKSELRVALLQRRMQGLLENLGVEERGWAEYTQRKLSEIHDKLLGGALGK